MIKGKYIDFLYWLILILYSNPGGIQNVLGVFEFSSRINLNDFLFIILGVLYIIKKKQYNYYDRPYMFLSKYILFFLFYFLFVFGYLTPNVNDVLNYSASFTIVKLRHAIYSCFLFIFTYHFYKTSSFVFIKMVLVTSIIILSLFIFGIITNTNIIPYVTYARGFIDVDRKLLISYGFLPLLIPLGVAFIVFKYRNGKLKNLILLGFFLMFLTWIISITRRHLVGTIILFLIAILLQNYLNKKSLLAFSGITRALFITFIVAGAIYLIFPKYINASYKAIEETVHIIEYGETSTGQKDERLQFNRTFIMDLFKKYPVLGTGFDNNWRTGEGDRLGYEASDYPFLGALAMTGLLGIIVFLPIYIAVIIFLLKDLSFMKKNLTKYNNYNAIILLIFIIYFIYDLLQYMNWFNPMSNYVFYNWYVYLAMYLAAKRNFYVSFFDKTNLTQITR